MLPVVNVGLVISSKSPADGQPACVWQGGAGATVDSVLVSQHVCAVSQKPHKSDQERGHTPHKCAQPHLSDSKILTRTHPNFYDRLNQRTVSHLRTTGHLERPPTRVVTFPRTKRPSTARPPHGGKSTPPTPTHPTRPHAGRRAANKCAPRRPTYHAAPSSSSSPSSTRVSLTALVLSRLSCSARRRP